MTDPDRPLPPYRRWVITQCVVGAVVLLVLFDGLLGLLGPSSQWKVTVGILALLVWGRTALPEWRRFRAERSAPPGRPGSPNRR